MSHVKDKHKSLCDTPYSFSESVTNRLRRLLSVLLTALQRPSWSRLTRSAHVRLQLLVHLTPLYKRRPFYWNWNVGSYWAAGADIFLQCLDKGHLWCLSYIKAFRLLLLITYWLSSGIREQRLINRQPSATFKEIWAFLCEICRN